MKAKLALLAAGVLLSGSAFGTVTLGISNAATGMLTNIADFGGSTANGLLWGVIVDSAGDGFDTSYAPGNVLNTTLSGVLFGGSNDDVLFIDTAVTTTNVPTAQGGPGAITQISSLVLNAAIGAGVNAGDAFMVIWFDRPLTAGATTQGGQHYGTFTTAGGAPAPFVMPPDGANQPFQANFVGADPVRTANQTFVPEPSSMLLGLLGALGLIRRRR